jgi:hypothetical protein
MVKALMVSTILGSALLAAPASAQFAQQAGRISLEPYVAYGFFGNLPGAGPNLEPAVAYGGKVGVKLSPQFALIGNYQRSQPEVEDFGGGKTTVDHWSAGVEFDYAPRGGAEGLIPILLEAGVGQARYQAGGLFGTSHNDLAANIGIGSAFRFTPNFSIRYGVNDYISNYRGGDGITNQVFGRIGAELRF